MSAPEQTSSTAPTTGTSRVKRAWPRCSRVASSWIVNAEQARIAEDAAPSPSWRSSGSRRHPRQGGVSDVRPRHDRRHHQRRLDPGDGKARIGRFVEAQVLQSLGVDYIDGSRCSPRPTTPTTSTSGRSRCPSSAVRPTSARRCAASPRRGDDRQGRGGTGDVSNATPHAPDPRGDPPPPEPRARRAVRRGQAAGALRVVKEVAEAGKLPVVLAGGIATPADAAMMMQLGAEGVFVGSGIFKSATPPSAPRPSSRPPPSSTTRT